MPCISGNFDPRDGIYHNVIILPVAPAFERNIVNQRLYGFKGLFDTGAQITCISQRVSQQVGLVPRGRGRIVSASEVKETNIYLFRVAFFTGPPSVAPDGKISGSVTNFGPFEGLEIHAEENDDVDVLVGMDILARGQFAVGFDGRYMFCW